MSDLRETINERMDRLQEMMESNLHLEKPRIVMEHTYTVSKFWSVLSEEDRDYIHAARDAIEEKLEWKV
jgi:hypothetical protein